MWVNLTKDWSFYWIEFLLISNKILLLKQFWTIIRKYKVIYRVNSLKLFSRQLTQLWTKSANTHQFQLVLEIIQSLFEILIAYSMNETNNWHKNALNSLNRRNRFCVRLVSDSNILQNCSLVSKLSNTWIYLILLYNNQIIIKLFSLLQTFFDSFISHPFWSKANNSYRYLIIVLFCAYFWIQVSNEWLKTPILR
jgi:hypothetical protein